MRIKLNVKHTLQRLLLVLVLVASVVALHGTVPAAQAEHNMPDHGMVCTENAGSSFTLTTKTGHISLPDGNVTYMWGFSEANSPFQHPSPILCVYEGDQVTIVLRNSADFEEPVSIIFPGQENVLADGQPSQPEYNGSGGLVSLAKAAQPGQQVTYTFTATKPGTFLYQSGTNPGIQVNMGLYGALVVRPADQKNLGTADYGFAYNGDAYRYTPAEEFIMILSEIDPYLHTAVEQKQPFNMNNYVARYWLINGRGFPDTIAPNGASWLPDQPYGSLSHIYPKDASHPYPALVRYISVGSEDYPFHPHGNHQKVIATDASPLMDGEDLSYEKFTVNIAPGQSLDAFFSWENVDQYHPENNPIPVTIPQLQNLVFGQFYSGSPYLGNTNTLPVGTQPLNQCGEYYHIAHNHALQKITAWGVTLAGHITFTRIDPPLADQNLPGAVKCP